MRRYFSIFFVLLLLVFSASRASAHGDDENEAADAPTLIKQAIVLLEGVKNIDEANDRILQALKDTESTLDKGKLLDAQKSLAAGDLDKTKELLVLSLGKNPNTALELAFRPKPKGGPAELYLTLFSVLLILTGLILYAIFRKEGTH